MLCSPPSRWLAARRRLRTTALDATRRSGPRATRRSPRGRVDWHLQAPFSSRRRCVGDAASSTSLLWPMLMRTGTNQTRQSALCVRDGLRGGGAGLAQRRARHDEDEGAVASPSTAKSTVATVLLTSTACAPRFAPAPRPHGAAACSASVTAASTRCSTALARSAGRFASSVGSSWSSVPYCAPASKSSPSRWPLPLASFHAVTAAPSAAWRDRSRAASAVARKNSSRGRHSRGA